MYGIIDLDTQVLNALSYYVILLNLCIFLHNFIVMFAQWQKKHDFRIINLRFHLLLHFN